MEPVTINEAISKIMEVMGYAVTVQPMKTEPGPRIKGQYVIVSSEAKKRGGDE